MSQDDKLVKLDPVEGARRYRDDPGSVFVLISNFGPSFGITNEEVLAELKAGNLVACGFRDKSFPHGIAYKEVSISGKALTIWLASDSAIAAKARAHIGLVLP